MSCCPPCGPCGARSAYLYPWDVDGDPAAADRIAGLGLTGVTLAAAYHAVRAVTPFHPGHRIVTRDAGVYFRPDPARWRDARLRPLDPDGDAAGSFERAAAALRAAGLRVTAWVVVAHNCRLARGPGVRGAQRVRGRLPLGAVRRLRAVAAYAAMLAAEIAALAGVDAMELEACGWYGFEHGSAHDKTGGPPGGARMAAGRLLLPRLPAARGSPAPTGPARRIRTTLDAATSVTTGGGAGRSRGRARRGREGRGPRWSPRSVRPTPGAAAGGARRRAQRRTRASGAGALAP